MMYILIAAPALLYLLFRIIEIRLIYVPGRIDAGNPSEMGVAYEDVWLETENGKTIHGWWFEQADAIATVIHCHGNAENISQRMGFVQDMLELPINLLMYDYQGYGKSEGRPGLHATRYDGRAAYAFVNSQHAEQGSMPIILLGQSLGGATAIELAAEREVQGLIIESTFTSIVGMGKHFHPYLLPQVFTTIAYDSLSKVPHLHMPKLFAHSPEDLRIPFDMGQQLYDASAEPKRWFELQGAHGEASFRQTPGYQEAVEKFIQDVVDNQAGT